jgi:hypothetical protein
LTCTVDYHRMVLVTHTIGAGKDLDKKNEQEKEERP